MMIYYSEFEFVVAFFKEIFDGKSLEMDFSDVLRFAVENYIFNILLCDGGDLIIVAFLFASFY